jgi:hypothetical protein
MSLKATWGGVMGAFSAFAALAASPEPEDKKKSGCCDHQDFFGEEPLETFGGLRLGRLFAVLVAVFFGLGHVSRLSDSMADFDAPASPKRG